MEREFLDVLDYELSVSEAELLDLHETLIPFRSSQPSAQLHPFFHASALERAPRPQTGVEMFRTRRITDQDDEAEDEDVQEDGSIYSGSFSGDELLPSTPALDETSPSLGEEARVKTSPSAPYSPETPTSSDSSSEPSSAAVSLLSYYPQMVSKPVTLEDNDAQRSAISRALWLAGHQLISTVPTTFPQIAVSA